MPLEHCSVNSFAMGAGLSVGASQIGNPINSISLSSQGMPKGASRDGGIHPVSRLLLRRNDLRLARPPSSGGISPVR